jgi:hypothetical protein
MKVKGIVVIFDIIYNFLSALLHSVVLLFAPDYIDLSN